MTAVEDPYSSDVTIVEILKFSEVGEVHLSEVIDVHWKTDVCEKVVD